jgi:hypothetical protein
MAINRGTTLRISSEVELEDAQGRRHVVGWGIAVDAVCRGHVKTAEIARPTLGLRLFKEARDAGLTVVVEHESVGIKWVRFVKP